MTRPLPSSSALTCGAAWPNAPVPCSLHPQQEADGERREQQRLGGQSGHGFDLDHLPDQAIAAETGRERERDPGRTAGDDGEVEHADRGQADGELLRHVESLAEHQHAQHHVQQRVDEVAEARVDHVAMGNRPDVEQPVDADQHGRDHQPVARAGICERSAHRTDVTAPGQPGEHQQATPDDPVRHDLERGQVVQRLHVEGQHAPDCEGRDGSRESATLPRCRWRLLRWVLAAHGARIVANPGRGSPTIAAAGRGPPQRCGIR